MAWTTSGTLSISYNPEWPGPHQGPCLSPTNLGSDPEWPGPHQGPCLSPPVVYRGPHCPNLSP